MSKLQHIRPVVLMVDDDRFAMEYYVRALNKNFDVVRCFTPDEALETVRQEREEITIITLDIMMPPGQEYKDCDTNKGLETGVLLYQSLRQLRPQIPIIVLTHVENQNTLEKFQSASHLIVCQKKDYPPRALVSIVAEMIERSGDA